MNKDIEKIQKEALEEISKAQDKYIQELRIKYLGKKGIIKSLMNEIKTLPIEERPDFGKAVNIMKSEIENAINERLSTIKQETTEHIDLTLPGRKLPQGGLHPISIIEDEIVDIFVRMGFSVEYGPEMETDYYNFEALNIPPYHPAREMHDTFYLKNRMLLRTHTSPVQIRAMLEKPPPIKIISPGRTYRVDPFDATHSPVFHQVEALWIDTDVGMSDLFGSLSVFAREIFGEEVKVKFVPDYFPFTEPSAEMWISCPFCKGKGCNVCKYTGWIEILGCGMVHYNVLRNVKYDSENYTGFAFGIGVERVLMIKYNIPDIRLFYENDIRFLEQFK